MSVVKSLKCDNPACARIIPQELVGEKEFWVRARLHQDGPISIFPGGAKEVDLDFCSWGCLKLYVDNV